MTDQARITINITPSGEELARVLRDLIGRPATDQPRRAEQAEERAEEEAANALRFANYLMAAQQECGAPNWPSLAEVVRALRIRAEQAEADGRGLLKALEADSHTIATWQQRAEKAEEERDAARTVLRAVSIAVGQWRNGDLSKYAALDHIEDVLTDQATAEGATGATPEGFRDFVTSHPDQFRALLRHEMRTDPEWWRRHLRREIRLGELTAQDLRRMGLGRP